MKPVIALTIAIALTVAGCIGPFGHRTLGDPEYPPDAWSVVIAEGSGTERTCGSELIEKKEKFEEGNLSFSFERSYPCPGLEAGRLFNHEAAREVHVTINTTLSRAAIQLPDSDWSRTEFGPSFPSTKTVHLPAGEQRVLVSAGDAPNATVTMKFAISWQ